MTRRKYIRIALTPDDREAFDEAKKTLEAATGVAMSDSMYALGVIRQSLAANYVIEHITKTGVLPRHSDDD